MDAIVSFVFTRPLSPLLTQEVTKVLKPIIASKQYGMENFLSGLVVDVRGREELSVRGC